MRLTFILQDFKKVGELTKQYSNLPDSYIKRSMEQVGITTRCHFLIIKYKIFYIFKSKNIYFSSIF